MDPNELTTETLSPDEKSLSDLDPPGGRTGRLVDRLRRSPRWTLAVGGTLAVVVIAVVVMQLRHPTEGVAQVRAPQSATTGTARVKPFRKARHMARISGAGKTVEYISHDELARECITRIGSEVLDEMINRKVIAIECGLRGIKVTSAEVKQEVVRLCKETGMEPSNWYQILKARHNMTPEQYHQNRIWPALAMKKLAGKSVQVTRDELQKAYEHHFGPRVKVRLVVYDNFRRANEGWNALQKAPSDFERLAKRDSIEPNSRSLGGLIPPIRKNSQNPKLEAEAFKLKVGEISGIVQYGTPARFAILKCEGHTKPEFVLKEVQEYLVKQLKDQKSQEAMAKHLLALKDRTRVDNYLLNKTTGGVARQAGFTRPATGAAKAKGVRPAAGSTRRQFPPRTTPGTRR
jgi:foldase protein PrsA